MDNKDDACSMTLGEHACVQSSVLSAASGQLQNSTVILQREFFRNLREFGPTQGTLINLALLAYAAGRIMSTFRYAYACLVVCKRGHLWQRMPLSTDPAGGCTYLHRVGASGAA